MSEKVALPAGCYGLDMPDGTKYSGKPGSTVTVEDHHAKQVQRSSNAHWGIISGRGVYTGIGTKRGRRCDDCGFLAQAWSTACPRCAGHTTEEGADARPAHH